MNKNCDYFNVGSVIKTVLSAGLLFAGNVNAYVDFVWYPDSGTKTFTYDMGSKSISDPEQNRAGKVVVTHDAFKISGTYYGTCKSGCTGATANNHTFFTAKVPDLPEVGVRDGLTFYKVTENIAVAMEIKTRINSTTLVNKAVPYTDIDNGLATEFTVSKAFATGTEGTISLMILKPFIGTTTIPPTVVARLWGTLNPSYHDESAILSQVSLTGTVVTNQTCDFTTGKVIKVDFGKIMLPDISAKGPVSGREKLINLDIKCTNISDGVAIKMKLNGDVDTNDAKYLKTTNADVGILISEADTSLPISPAGGVFPASGSIVKDYSDYTSQLGSVKLNAVPVNSSGRKPAQGSFSATSTVTIELQ